MPNPTLSVIISNYNHAHYLPTALDAILSQSYQPKEVIIVDDVSTDDSLNILESYAAKCPVIKLIRNEKNVGAVANVNRQLECATGDYVYIAGADDKVLPGFFEKTMALLISYPQAGLCSALTLQMNVHGENIGLSYLPIVSKAMVYFSPEQCRSMICRYNNWIHSSAALYRRDAILTVGKFIPELQSYCDIFAGLVIALKYGVCYIPEPFAAFRITGNNYCMVSMGSRKNAIEIFDNVVKIMNSTHANLFPSNFIEEMEKTKVYHQIIHFSRLTRVSEALILPAIDKPFIIKLLYYISQPIRYLINIFIKLYSFYSSGRNVSSDIFLIVMKFHCKFRLCKIRQIKI